MSYEPKSIEVAIKERSRKDLIYIMAEFSRRKNISLNFPYKRTLFHLNWIASLGGYSDLSENPNDPVSPCFNPVVTGSNESISLSIVRVTKTRLINGTECHVAELDGLVSRLIIVISSNQRLSESEMQQAEKPDNTHADNGMAGVEMPSDSSTNTIGNKAGDIINTASKTMARSAKQYDQKDGERSMDKVIAAFNALRGTDLNASDGMLIMALLKVVRSQRGERMDSTADLVAYAALYGEAIISERGE